MSNDIKKKENEAKVTRLAVFFPTHLDPNSEHKITVKALTQDGEVDKNRNDTVEVTLNEASATRLKEGGKKLTVKLVNGEEGIYLITGSGVETIIINIKWIEGESPLQSTTISLLTGGSFI